MRPRWTSTLAVTLLCLALHAPVSAQVAVLSAEDSPSRPGLIETLRIQLAGIATVIDGGTLKAGTHSERIEQALGVTELHATVAAIWVEGPEARSDGSGELVMYVVGRRNDRAIVDVLRVPTVNTSDMDASIDRSLALKVRQVLSDLMQGHDVIEAPVPRVSSDLNDNPSLRALVVLGLLAQPPSGGFGLVPGLRVGAGVRVPLFGGVLDWIARAHLTPRSRVLHTDGVIELQDLSPAIEAAYAHRFGDVSVGARVGGQLRIVDVRGQTNDGAVGTDAAWLPALLAGPFATVAVHRSVEIALGADAELSLSRQRYALNQQFVTDTGRVRLTLHASLVLLVP